MTHNVGLACALLASCGATAEGVHHTPEPAGSESPVPSAAALDCERAAFASPAIEAIVRRELAFILEDDSYLTRPGPFSQQELSLVTSVATLEPVNSLAGLECLLNLSILSTESGGEVSSLEPLRPLAQLTKVSLANMQVKDLTPLNEKRSLKKLDVSGNPIETLAGLELPPGDPECPYVLDVKDTAISPDELQRFCEQDWYVIWIPGVPDGSCNRSEWANCHPLK